MSSIPKATSEDVKSSLNELERLLVNSSIKDQCILDVFIVSHNERCSSTLRPEETVTESVEHGSFAGDT